jgi:hypothetical protein
MTCDNVKKLFEYGDGDDSLGFDPKKVKKIEFSDTL